MFCSKCGAQLQETDRYCTNCGAPTNAAAPQNTTDYTTETPYRPTNNYITSYGSYDNGNGYGSDVRATGGLKGWLWFIIIANAIGALYILYLLITVYTYYGSSIYTVLGLAEMAISGVNIYAATRLMSGYKFGFYLFCGSVGLLFIINLLSGAYSYAAGNVIAPVVLWLFLKNQWPYFK